MGEADRIVGISAFTVRPPRLARRSRPPVSGPEAVLERKPDVYLASWCGRKFRPDYLQKRPAAASLARIP